MFNCSFCSNGIWNSPGLNCWASNFKLSTYLLNGSLILSIHEILFFAFGADIITLLPLKPSASTRSPVVVSNFKSSDKTGDFGGDTGAGAGDTAGPNGAGGRGSGADGDGAGVGGSGLNCCCFFLSFIRAIISFVFGSFGSKFFNISASNASNLEPTSIAGLIGAGITCGAVGCWITCGITCGIICGCWICGIGVCCGNTPVPIPILGATPNNWLERLATESPFINCWIFNILFFISSDTNSNCFILFNCLISFGNSPNSAGKLIFFSFAVSISWS